MARHVGGLLDMEDKGFVVRSNNVFNDVYIRYM